MQVKTLVLAGLALALLPSLAEAQRQRQPTRRRQPTIEIRGQVPTPQVVTVRPRAVPTYSRRVLVPNFYDHDFWPSILPAYQLVRARAISGAPLDSAAASGAAGDSATNRGVPAPSRVPPARGTGAAADSSGTVPSGTVPSGTVPGGAGTPPANPPR